MAKRARSHSSSKKAKTKAKAKAAKTQKGGKLQPMDAQGKLLAQLMVKGARDLKAQMDKTAVESAARITAEASRKTAEETLRSCKDELKAMKTSVETERGRHADELQAMKTRVETERDKHSVESATRITAEALGKATGEQLLSCSDELKAMKTSVETERAARMEADSEVKIAMAALETATAELKKEQASRSNAETELHSLRADVEREKAARLCAEKLCEASQAEREIEKLNTAQAKTEIEKMNAARAADSDNLFKILSEQNHLQQHWLQLQHDLPGNIIEKVFQCFRSAGVSIGPVEMYMSASSSSPVPERQRASITPPPRRQPDEQDIDMETTSRTVPSVPELQYVGGRPRPEGTFKGVRQPAIGSAAFAVAKGPQPAIGAAPAARPFVIGAKQTQSS